MLNLEIIKNHYTLALITHSHNPGARSLPKNDCNAYDNHLYIGKRVWLLSYEYHQRKCTSTRPYQISSLNNGRMQRSNNQPHVWYSTV